MVSNEVTEWHGFNWTADGHTPKIDARTPSELDAGLAYAEAFELRPVRVPDRRWMTAEDGEDYSRPLGDFAAVRVAVAA